jgi:hypothetical protein
MDARKPKNRFERVSRTPCPLLSDSDVLALGLVTAQALEAEGDIEQAARWLRRAARQAKAEGRLQRGVLIARAANELANADRFSAAPERVAPATERSARKSFLRASNPSHERLKRFPRRAARIFDLRSADPALQRASVWEAMLTLLGAGG